MRRVWSAVVLATVFLLGAAFAGQAASLEEAKAFGKKAAAYVEANGKDRGIAEIGNPKGKFVKGDMFVTLLDTNGNYLANPVNSILVGQNHLNLRDADGRPFVNEMIEIVRTKGGGWVTYRFTHPVTKKLQLKKAWVQRVEGTDLFTICGIFQ